MLGQLKRDTQLFLDLIFSSLRDKHLLKRRPVKFWRYQTREGIVFKLRRQVWDSGIIIETWWLNEYLRHLKKINGRAVVIDVGAHIGSFSILAASKFKNIKILAFEPNPDNFNLLKENIRINGLEKKIFPFRLAVNDTGGKQVRFNLHPDNSGMHSLVLSCPGFAGRKNYFTAETISLAEVFEKNKIKKCDFLKMDCEGSEYLILPSTSVNLLKRIKNLSLEYHPGGDIKKLGKSLQKAGFQIKLERAVTVPLVGRLINIPLLSARRKD